MKLSEFKNSLMNIESINIQLPNGTFVPSHFHITEMGLLTKNFIDCGNTIREEKLITFQLWFAGDLEHRLTSEKVFKIIAAGPCSDFGNGTANFSPRLPNDTPSCFSKPICPSKIGPGPVIPARASSAE